MKKVGAYEAKVHWSRLLDEVEKGESVEITRNGKTVARLSPANGVRSREEIEEAIAWMLAFRKGRKLGVPFRRAIEEGRRY